MKKVIIILGIFLITTTVYAQSLSASKIISILENQSLSAVAQRMETSGFTYDGTSKFDGNMVEYRYHKTTSHGTEAVTIGGNDELYSVVYKMANANVLNALREKMLTYQFVYAYSYKNSRYYESTNMRIGVNTGSNILSFFVAKK